MIAPAISSLDKSISVVVDAAGDRVADDEDAYDAGGATEFANEAFARGC